MTEEDAAPTPDPDDRQAPLPLWRAVRVFLCELFSVFGEPQELAPRTLTLKQHQLIVPWIRAGEALLRRFIFLEAAIILEDESANPPAARKMTIAQRSATKTRQRKRVEHDPDHPESWHVSFKTLPGQARARARRAGTQSNASSVTPGSGVKSLRSAWPLAERFEALLRAYNDPMPYARRLARRLRKQTALASRITASAWQEFRDIIGRTLFDLLGPPLACAERVAIAAHADSS